MNKKHIIKDNKEFLYIIKNGKYKNTPYFTIYYKKGNNNTYRFGFSVSKKIGIAVLRNKIKRRIKEIARKNVNYYKNNDNYIIICRKKLLDTNFFEADEAFRKAIIEIKEGE